MKIDVETLNSFPKPRDLEFIGMSNLFFPNGTLFSLHNFSDVSRMSSKISRKNQRHIGDFASGSGLEMTKMSLIDVKP